jgi:small subunit ribosomal protein S5
METKEKNQKKLKSEKKDKFFGKSSSFRKDKKKSSVRLSKLKFVEKVVQVKKVVKVVKGGKKLSFRAVVILGDTKRKVGVGIGKAEDVNLAIEKAILYGKKKLINVPLTLKSSIPHVIQTKFGACKIMLRPASVGTGVIAGGAIRSVLELAGIQNISAKQFGSSNILNNAKATILALNSLTEKVELGKAQSSRKQLFYEKIMKKYKNVKLF